MPTEYGLFIFSMSFTYCTINSSFWLLLVLGWYFVGLESVLVPESGKKQELEGRKNLFFPFSTVVKTGKKVTTLAALGNGKGSVVEYPPFDFESGLETL